MNKDSRYILKRNIPCELIYATPFFGINSFPSEGGDDDDYYYYDYNYHDNDSNDDDHDHDGVDDGDD